MLVCWNKKKWKKRKKDYPFCIFLVLAFYFLASLKQSALLLRSESCSPSCEMLWEGCFNVYSQQMCWAYSCCALGWSGLCSRHRLEVREWMNEIKRLEMAVSGLELCCVEQLLFFWAFPVLFCSAKDDSKKLLLCSGDKQGSLEGLNAGP